MSNTVHYLPIQVSEDQRRAWFLHPNKKDPNTPDKFPIFYCGNCQNFEIHCFRYDEEKGFESECLGTSCNGGGCDECDDAFGEWNKINLVFYWLMHDAMVNIRKNEKQYLGTNISFFDRLGVDWENGERPKREG